MIAAAVIGCGRMGAFTSDSVRRYAPDCWFPLAHAEAIAAHPDVTLAGLCDPVADNLARAQAAYGNPAGYADVATLAAEVAPQLVGIATRTIGRAEIIKTLFDRGTRAFHIEKPLCNSVAELDALTPILMRDDVFATYGSVRRFFDIYARALAMVHDGAIGDLLEIRLNFGPGALYWVHPHAIDLILFAAVGRQVSGVQARFEAVEPGAQPGEVANDPVLQSATIWFDDGVAGHIGRAPGLDMILSGTAGEIAVRSDGRAIEIATARGDDPYLVRETIDGPTSVSGPQGTLAPISQLVACLQGDADAIAANRVNKRDILAGQRIAFAMLASHARGSAIVGFDAIDPAMSVLARTGGNYA